MRRVKSIALCAALVLAGMIGGLQLRAAQGPAAPAPAAPADTAALRA